MGRLVPLTDEAGGTSRVVGGGRLADGSVGRGGSRHQHRGAGRDRRLTAGSTGGGGASPAARDVGPGQGDRERPLFHPRRSGFPDRLAYLFRTGGGTGLPRPPRGPMAAPRG